MVGGEFGRFLCELSRTAVRGTSARCRMCTVVIVINDVFASTHRHIVVELWTQTRAPFSLELKEKYKRRKTQADPNAKIAFVVHTPHPENTNFGQASVLQHRSSDHNATGAIPATSF